jgi:hypothetical protein
MRFGCALQGNLVEFAVGLIHRVDVCWGKARLRTGTFPMFLFLPDPAARRIIYFADLPTPVSTRPLMNYAFSRSRFV